MSYTSAEVKSGFFIVLSLVFLLALSFIVGSFMTGSTQSWQIRFGYVSGLETNAPVYFAGHQVGKVDRIDVVNNHKKSILVTVRISDKIQIRTNSRAYIDTLGLMGEKFVEITPGAHQKPLLKKGAVLEGTDPVAMYLLIQKMNVLADRMDEMTASLNPIMKRFDEMLTGHEEEIAKTISNFHETSSHIRDMTHDLKYRPWRLVRKG